MSMLNGVHHVAYRCKNAKETVEWYKNSKNIKEINDAIEKKLFSR